MLHGERKKGKSRSQHPPTSFPQAVGMHRGNFDSLLTAASLPPPRKRRWTTLHPLNSPVRFILLFEALLLPRPLSSHLHPFLHLIQIPSGISTWLSRWEQGFPNCDTSTIPCMWDTPKLLLNTIQIVDPLLLHILFTKPKWHTPKWGWPRKLLLGRRGLDLFPTSTAYSRHLLPVQFLFSKSLLLYKLPRLIHLRKKGS